MPLGYLQEDNGGTGVRTGWTPDDTHTPVSTWRGDSVLKFSAGEILARGEAGEAIRAEVRTGLVTGSHALCAMWNCTQLAARRHAA